MLCYLGCPAGAGNDASDKRVAPFQSNLNDLAKEWDPITNMAPEEDRSYFLSIFQLIPSLGGSDYRLFEIFQC